MLGKAKLIDATEGPILKKIFLYALPLILSTLIQKLFNAVDMVVLGQMADSIAVASVGASSTIVSLIVDTFVGLSSGTKIIFARQFGAKDGARIKKTEDTSIILSVILGTVVAVIGFIFAPWFLSATNCPTECFEGAELYIRIYVLAAPAVLLYNFGSSVLTAAGDTQRPLYYIIVGGIVNVVLNVILCFILPQKVIAVAVATLASQVVCAFLVIYRLYKMEGLGKLDIKNMRFSMQSLGKILRFGLPLALNHALFPIANLQIQTAVNAYGVASTAGNSAGSTLDGIISSFTAPFSTTCATFMGQNFGAKNEKRAQKSLVYCIVSSAIIGGLVGILFLLLSKTVLLPILIGQDALAIEFGYWRMFFVAGFYFIPAIYSVFSSAIQAYGYSTITALISIICVFGFRMFWMLFIYPPHHAPGQENYINGFQWLVSCFTISWVLIFISNVTAFFIVRSRAKKNGIKQI